MSVASGWVSHPIGAVAHTGRFGGACARAVSASVSTAATTRHATTLAMGRADKGRPCRADRRQVVSDARKLVFGADVAHKSGPVTDSLPPSSTIIGFLLPRGRLFASPG